MSTAVESPKLVKSDTRRHYSYEELVTELPESNQPCELWDGELITPPTPSFFHQKIVFRFQRPLHDWVEARKLGKVVGAPIDMVLSPHRAMQPDVVFIARERLGIVQRVVMGSGDLVAEVGWSRRHFGERFREEIGLSPKVASRVVRFERARQLLTAPDRPGLAATCGFA